MIFPEKHVFENGLQFRLTLSIADKTGRSNKKMAAIGSTISGQVHNCCSFVDFLHVNTSHDLEILKGFYPIERFERRGSPSFKAMLDKGHFGYIWKLEKALIETWVDRAGKFIDKKAPSGAARPPTRTTPAISAAMTAMEIFTRLKGLMGLSFSCRSRIRGIRVVVADLACGKDLRQQSRRLGRGAVPQSGETRSPDRNGCVGSVGRDGCDAGDGDRRRKSAPRSCSTLSRAGSWQGAALLADGSPAGRGRERLCVLGVAARPMVANDRPVAGGSAHP